MKVRALKEFEKYTDKERNNCKVTEGDTWEVTEERAKFLMKKGVVEEVKEVIKPIEPIEEEIKLVEKPKKSRKKKN